MEKIYYYTGENYIKNDPLSDFLYKCNIKPKAFGYQCSSESTNGMRLIGDMELIYYLSGESIVTINDKIYFCHAGDVLIVPQYVFYKIDTASDKIQENFWLHFDLENIIYQKQLISLISDEYLINIGLDDKLISLYKNLNNEFENQTMGSHAIINSIVTQIFSKIMQKINIGNNNLNISSANEFFQNKISSTMRILNECVRYISDKKGSVTVNQVCAEMFISPSYLRKIFSENIGISPIEFIHTIRLKQAEIMLISTEKSISDIASELGYSSAYHFSRDFSNKFGTAPSSFRKNSIN